MKLVFSIIIFLLSIQVWAGDYDAVQALAQRRVPWLNKHLKFEKLKDTTLQDAFELSTNKGTLVIKATGPNAAATGLNWYLKYYCHRSMSHMGDNLDPVFPLPEIHQPVKIEAPATYRYALNFCTYNYTMSFYSWKDWEREIDWMALNGVNLMLVANGMEAVWQNTLKKLGYSNREINDFLVGPAYNAWWLMGNIQKWGGPMPQSMINSRKVLQQKMIRHMKELGIEPVLTGFYGVVPSSFKEKSKAHIIKQGNWCAFKRPDILDPTDTAFTRIARIYYTEIQRIYGKDIHFFAGDPFHEGGITEGVNLSAAGASIQEAMNRYFPGSTWVLQGWQDNPKKELLNGLDKSKVLIQELFGEFTNNWEKRNGYESTPFVWCVVNNFGERPGLYGKLQRYADEVERIKKGPFNQYLKGIGIMPEGINNNPAVYDLMLELGWRKEHVDVKEWITNYVAYRYGTANPTLIKAWGLLLETIYNSIPGYQEGAPESVFCARPNLEIKSTSLCGTRTRNYDVNKFEEAVKLFAQVAAEMKESDTYRIDLINLTRQVLANKGDIVFQQIGEAVKQKDLKSFNEASVRFLDMITLTDDLLSIDPFFRLNTWKKQTQRLGNTQAEKRMYLHNLMMLITYWGENNAKEDYLHEYAYKEWSGLMNNFYKERWKMYFDSLRQQLTGQKAADIDFFHWERKWVENNEKIDDKASNNHLDSIVKRILEQQ